MEVKTRRINVEKVKNKLHFVGSFYVEGTNSGGRPALFWRHVNTVKLLGFSKNFIENVVCLVVRDCKVLMEVIPVIFGII